MDTLQDAFRRTELLELVAEYIVSCEGREYEDYIGYCKDNNVEPADLSGVVQSKHVYSQALRGLGLEFPID